MRQIIKWIGYVLGILLLAYTAVLYNSVALLFTAVVLFWLPILELLLLMVQSRKITVTISKMAEAMTKGEACYLWITITNSSRFPLLLLSLTFMEPDSKMSRDIFVTLNAGETGHYKLSFVMERCGISKISACDGWLQDYMGYFRLPFRRQWEEQVFVVYPRERIQPIIKEAFMMNQGMEKEVDGTKRGNRDSQPLGVRSYFAGDSLKHIHWKLSAKQGDLVVREYSEDVCEMHLIVVDAEALKNSSVKEREYAYEGLASLSCSLLKEGCSHYVAIFFKESESSTPVIKRYSVQEQSDWRTYMYILYQLMEQSAKEQSHRINESKKKDYTKEEQLAIYNQHYIPFSQECVSYVP